ncbi:MAG: hypothetical protein RR447_07520 [Algoriella sp.]
MKIEEIQDFLRNTKIYVGNKSAEVQKKLKEFGIIWVINTDKPFLFIEDTLTLKYSCDLNCFKNPKYKEIFIDEVLNLKVNFKPKRGDFVVNDIGYISIFDSYDGRERHIAITALTKEGEIYVENVSILGYPTRFATSEEKERLLKKLEICNKAWDSGTLKIVNISECKKENVMNENLNLVEILKDCPKGTKLYSTIYGEIEFDGISKDRYPIKLTRNNEECIASVTSEGKHDIDYDGECTLFPSKECRDWSKFKVPVKDLEIGTKVMCTDGYTYWSLRTYAGNHKVKNFHSIDYQKYIVPVSEFDFNFDSFLEGNKLKSI